MTTRGAVRTLTAVAFLALAAITAGCGSAANGDPVATTSNTPLFGVPTPIPAEDPDTFVIDARYTLSRAETRAECGPVYRINRRSTYRFKCPISDAAKFSLRFYGTNGKATYGTGAVVDYETQLSDGNVSSVLSLLPSGEWSVSRFALLNPESVGTEDGPSRAGFDRAVGSFLAAARDDDCSDYTATVVDGRSQGEDACNAPKARALARSARTNPRARPRYLGGNATFGFYGIAFDRPKPTYWTISTIRSADGAIRPYAVLDAVPGPVTHAR